MTNDETARVVQLCRTCGGGAPIEAHFCPQCTKILSLGRHADYFTFFGLPRKLNLDAGELERRFRALSREFHPDYFYNATPVERRASLERSSYLNDAYRVLRQPTARIEYLLSLEGLGGRAQADGATPAVPPSLLEEVFALNEELDEVRELKASGARRSCRPGRRTSSSARVTARSHARTELSQQPLEWNRPAASGACVERSTQHVERLYEQSGRHRSRHHEQPRRLRGRRRPGRHP
jgi:curved DNA-binding protein CbpA